MRKMIPLLAFWLCLISGQLFSQEWTTTEQYGTYNKDGFVFCNDRWSGTDVNVMAVQTGPDLFSYWTIHDVTNRCCNSPYACIGTLSGDPDWGKSDQYGLPGSHLPIKLNEIEVLKGKWTFQIPMPISMDNQYRIYYEIFLSNTTAGTQGAGNICIVFWDNQFEHYNGQPFGTTYNVNGYTMDVLWESNPYGQGDMTDCVFPLNTYTPDANGIITVPEMDIKAVLDWCMTQYPGSYNPDSYLAHLSLAYEVMTLHGTIKTTFASFNLKKTGSPAYYTPEWTSANWGPSVPVTGVTVIPTSSTLNIGVTKQLTATVLPTNATNKSVTWSSSNTSIATVSASGLVTAVAPGAATITVITNDGNKTATSDITVNAASENIALNKTATASSVYSSTYSAAKAVDGNTSTMWRSNNSDTNPWIYVDLGNTYNINRVKLRWSTYYGKAYKIQTSANASTWTDIAALTGQNGGTDDNTSLSGSGRYIRIYVTTKSSSSLGMRLIEYEIYGTLAGTISVTGVTVSPTEATISGIGATQQLTATVLPTNASNQNVTWSTSNASVATVSTGGLVTSVASGVATISVTTVDGGKTATCPIIVTSGSGTNLITNPDFESQKTGWTVGSHWTASTVDKHSGTYSLLLSGTGDWCNAYQVIPVTAYTNYNLSAYLKGTSQVYYGIYTSDWSSTIASQNNLPTSSWAQYSKTFNSGNNTSVIIDIQDASSGSTYIDDVSLLVSGSKSTAADAITISSEGSSELSIYPNPLDASNLRLNVSGLTEGSMDISVIDIQGKTVFQNQLKVSGASTDVQLENMNSGLYFIKVINNNRVMSNKLIVR